LDTVTAPEKKKSWPERVQWTGPFAVTLGEKEVEACTNELSRGNRYSWPREREEAK